MVSFVGLSHQLVDLMTSPEIIASDLGRIESIGGGQACFVFYRNTISPISGAPEQQVCGRLFMPFTALRRGIHLSRLALDRLESHEPEPPPSQILVM